MNRSSLFFRNGRIKKTPPCLARSHVIFLVKLLAAAIVFACMPVTALAMPYSQLIIFGDSLSDSGQFPDTASAFNNSAFSGARRAINRVGPTYLDGSSEPFSAVFTQRLAEHLGLNALPSTPALQGNLPGGTNYAVSGYRTDQVLYSITTESVTIIPPGYSGAGLVLARRTGYLGEFHHADPRALYYINGGGNDVQQGIIVDAASARQAAEYLVTGVAALQRAGARVIIVSDLPDIGMSPQGIESGQRESMSASAALFNQELDRQLTGLEGNVVRLNFRGLLNEVQDNLAGFGFDSSFAQTDYCFSDCGTREHPVWGISGSSPNPDQLLFSDSVHPTRAVHQISADYIHSIIAAPWEVSLLPEMALSSLLSLQQLLQEQLPGPALNWQRVGQWRSFFSTSGMRRNFKVRAGVAEAESDGLGLTLGGSFRLDKEWRAGLALGLQSQELGTRTGSEYDLRSYLLSGFAQYQQERVWVKGSLSLGVLDYRDVRRQFPLGITERTERGNSDGQVYALSGRIGYDLANPVSKWQVSPFMSADVARIEVNGYREYGNRSTAMTLHDQQRDTRRLGLGLQLNRQLAPGTLFHAEIAHEREFEDDPQQVQVSLTSVADNNFILQGYTPPDDQTLASLSITHRLRSHLDLNAGYLFRGGEDRQHGLNLGLSWTF
jgi:outer membrane lipase/esterase